MKTVASPNAFSPSARALVNASARPAASSTLRMPRPPPPAVALIISGKPIASACLRASSIDSTGPPLHGATGTPDRSARCLASILSPSVRITSARGADEHDAEPIAQFGELRPFGHEPPADPRRIGPRRDERPLQRREVEVRTPRVGRPVVVEADGFVGLAYEHRRPFRPGVQGDHAEVGVPPRRRIRSATPGRR